MKITQVQAQVLQSYEYPNGGWVLVRARTEDGVEGVGECFVPDRDGHAAFAARDLIPEVTPEEVDICARELLDPSRSAVAVLRPSR